MKKAIYVLLAVALGGFHSCLIENDMSYPRVYGDITAFEVSGQVRSEIDPSGRTVQVELSETADITALEITEFRLSAGARCEDRSFAVGETIDLSEPKVVVISTYQDYEWTISAAMPVERYVRCENQADEAVFDFENNTVSLTVTQNQSLSDVRITAMKLGIEGSVIYLVKDGTETECTFPITLDCSSPNTFRVDENGVSTEWTLNVTQRNVRPEITSVIPWCYHADIKAEFASDDPNMLPVIQYRTGSEEWKDVKVDASSVDGINITASITDLAAGTMYSVRLVLDGEAGTAVDFTTGSPQQIRNMGFDEWWMNDKGTWYPNLNETVKIWDTANGGTALLRRNPTVPEYEFLATDDPDNKAAAKLESMNVVMFAAGNLYTGEFRQASFSGNIGAVLDWGTPFSGRPSALKGYYCYKPAVVNYAKAPYEHLKGTMDKCQLLVILTDWDHPFTVDTAQGIFMDQTPENESIIAYGKFESDEDTDGKYREFTLDLEYWRPEATPTYAVVISCASYKGDYFTGGLGSVLYVDEFEFLYE